MTTATTPREKFHAAIDQQDIWKPGEMRNFAIALVAAAVRKLREGSLHFSTDDVAETDHPGSTGISGSVIEKLKNANVIKPVGVTHAGKWYADHIRSTRPTSKGRWIGKYELCSVSLAETFLRRNAVNIARQLELGGTGNLPVVSGYQPETSAPL